MHSYTKFVLSSVLLVLAIAGNAGAQTESSAWAECKNENYRFALDNAIAACSGLITSETDQAQVALALTYRATAYTDQRNYANAIADFDHAISLNPQLALAFSNRGIAYAFQANFERAMADFNQATRIDPHFAPAFSNRGMLYHYEHEDVRAIAEFDEAIRLAPTSSLDFNNRSLAYTAIGNPAYAIADADHAIRLQPNNPTWLNTRCWARAVWGQELDRALADCDASIAIRSDPNALDTRGLVHLRRGEFQAAFDDFDTALQANAALATSQYGRGIALTRLGRTAEGETDIRTATARDPSVQAKYAGYGLTP